MNKAVRIAWAVSIVAIVAASCAKEPSDNLGEKQMAAFDAWVGLYGDGAEKQPSGIYIKKLHSASGVIKPPVEYDWIQLDYTGRIMVDGDVFVTRDSAVAVEQGTFEYFTHYVPQMIQFYEDGDLPRGVYDAVGTMNEGDRVRVYVPYTLAYGNYGRSFTGGYQGQVSSVPAQTPIIMDLELKKIISDPLRDESNEVAQYASRNWGQTIADTLKTGLYRRSLRTGLDTATVKDDSIAYVYYVGRFMDGFVFDTNIADTARKYHIYDNSSSSKYDSLVVSLKSEDMSVVRGFYEAIKGMRYGETAEALFTSTYGYGSTGQAGTSTTTEIPPYAPLMFTIEVIPLNGDGTAQHPYNITAVKGLPQEESNVWITGYIVGVVDGTSVEENAQYAQTVSVKTNILLSDKRTAKKASEVIAVELPEGPIRDALNLADNKLNYRVKIALKGNIRPYLGQRGMTGVTQYVK